MSSKSPSKTRKSELVEEEACVVIKPGNFHEAIPNFLVTRNVRGATREALGDGCSKIKAPRTRKETLLAALRSLGIQLAEEV